MPHTNCSGPGTLNPMWRDLIDCRAWRSSLTGTSFGSPSALGWASPCLDISRFGQVIVRLLPKAGHVLSVRPLRTGFSA